MSAPSPAGGIGIANLPNQVTFSAVSMNTLLIRFLSFNNFFLET